MPAKNSKVLINLDLLKPQSSPEILPAKFLKWLLSSGRFIFILVEALVLIAFVARFKLDSDLASKKEVIETEIPFVQSLGSYEILIRQTQLKLSTISTFRANSPNYSQVLSTIASQTPLNVTILTLNMEKEVGKVVIMITTRALDNNDVSNFVTGLRESGEFSQVNLESVGLEQGIINFIISAEKTIQDRGTNL